MRDDDLPPEEVVDDLGRCRREREDAVEHGPERGGEGGDEERQIDAARTRRRAHELPEDKDDEDRSEHAVGDDAERVLQEVDDSCAVGDQQQVLARERIEVAEPLRSSVEQQDRERETRSRRRTRPRETLARAGPSTRPYGYAKVTCVKSA